MCQVYQGLGNDRIARRLPKTEEEWKALVAFAADMAVKLNEGTGKIRQQVEQWHQMC